MKYLPIASAVFLIVAMTVQFVVSYQRNKNDLEERIHYKMELAQKDFLFEVYDMHDATSEIVHFMPDYLENPNDINSLMEIVLWRFPDLYSCYVGFVPDYFPAQGESYAVCAEHVTKDSIISYRFEDQLNYFDREWYTGAMQSTDAGYWSQPYRDVSNDDYIFTHSQKLYDSHDRVIGVACADYTLDGARKILSDTKPYDDAVCRLYSSNGTLIVQSSENDDWERMIVSEKVLSPVDMRLVIAVPKSHLWDGMSNVSIITFLVLLFGILAAGMLIRRIWRDQEAYARVETANQVMEHELHIASNIQMGILREGLRGRVKGEPWPDVALQATLVPMREVGGDLYDFFRKGDDLFFVIGDVSGKSVTAAMLMSATVNLFRSAVRRLQSPKVIMEEMNAVLSENNPSLMFVTAFIGRLHVPTGELLYCNAGHLPPLKVSGQQSAVSMLALQPNIPLGYDGKYRFIEQGTMLAQDDMVVLYTDGITEARDENREMLGMQRWVEIVKNNLQELIDGNMLAIREAGMRFTGEAEQADDMTLMIIRKTGDAQPLNIRVENRIDQWPVLRAALHNYGVCADMDTRSLKKMEMALEEAVVNIVNYSQAEYIDLTIRSQQTADERRFAVQLTDNGVAFDPTARPDTDTAQLANDRQIGGLGIALLKQIADEVHYSRIDDRNELILIKKI